MSYSKKKVIVIEDNDILLDSYEYYLSTFEDYNLKGLYTNVNDALNEYENIYPDIIISDISMPGINGIDAISKFRALDSSVKIILISVHDDMRYVLNSIENNVDGYLTKPITKISLLKALESLNKGGVPLTGDISKLLINILKRERDQDKFDKDLFSAREREILKLFTSGYTYKNIAETLFITHSTVNFHIQNIYDKLNVRNKTEAINSLKSKGF